MKILLYFPLFILGVIAGFFYFSHLWKSINIYGTEKNKILLSMIIRLPIPVGAVLIGGFLAGIGGIISVLIGFTLFQVVFLVNIAKKLKKEVEAEALKEENSKSEEV
ncbi:MAG: ATP synthase subunit I [Aquificae bacterium]|nr:ATP synthase subunit I [Aquificota bacterium]